MKSRAGSIGSINLRGKKFHVLSCGCCTMQDFRDREHERQAHREIDEAICSDDEIDLPDIYEIDAWERQLDQQFDKF